MSAGYNVYVDDDDKAVPREYVTTAKDSEQANDFLKYLDPKLPQGLKSTWHWDVRPPDCKQFDMGRLVETPNEPPKEETP
jgi:predicted dithiol-disulfide oxidoreductase (DUF899 family)